MKDAGDDSPGITTRRNINSISNTGGHVPLPQDTVLISLSGRTTKRPKLNDDDSANVGCRAGVSYQDFDSSWLALDADAAAAASNAQVAVDESLEDRKPAAAKANISGAGAMDSESSLSHDDDNCISSNPQKRKIEDVDNCHGDDGNSKCLPVAPSLEEYLNCDGHIKYAPRPEWCSFTKDPSEVPVAAASREVTFPIEFGGISGSSDDNAGGGRRPPPVDGVGDSGRRNNNNNFAIHEDDATVPARGGHHNPLVAPAAGRRGSRHQASLLEQLVVADDRSQRLGRAQLHLQSGGDRNRRQHDHENANPFEPLLLRRVQLYRMARGVQPDESVPSAARILPMGRIMQAQLAAGIPRPHDGEEGEADEEGVINDEGVAEEADGLARGDGAHREDNRELALRTSFESFTQPLSFKSLLTAFRDKVEAFQDNGRVAVFGYECDTALHKAIKLNATEAALRLIGEGACVDIPNAKGITPLIIASQEGNLEVVMALLNKGANPNTAMPQRSGSTALIQASHFGKLAIVGQLLRHGAEVNKSNLRSTTALMRASQEGHEDVVRLLLSHYAAVNLRNDERMTSLMLASQRGHASIVGMLVKAGAQVDAKTYQDSTSLMLACKRKHLDVAKILVASGTELKLKDGKNRTVLETATRRGHEAFVQILTDSAQIRLMQEESRRERNFEMARIWKLLQLEMATVQLGTTHITIHDAADCFMGRDNNLKQLCHSKRALVLAMTLPAPLVELISDFIPLPLIWEKRLMLLTSRSHVDPDSAVFNALDLIDEVLEVGGLLDAFDAARVDPPTNFSSWSAHQMWRSRLGAESSQTHRRACNYLQVLARAHPSFSTIIHSYPYDMPVALFSKLKAVHDIQSAVRRLSGGGIHFDMSIANEMVVIARTAVMWCESRPMY